MCTVLSIVCVVILVCTIGIFLELGDPRVIPPGWTYERLTFAKHVRGLGLLVGILEALFFPGKWLFNEIRRRAHLNQIKELARLKEQERQHT